MANANLSDRPLIAIIWDDAHGRTAGEYTVEEILRDFHEPSTIITFGILIADDEKGVSVANEITGTEATEDATTYRGVGFVPRGMIRDVINLGVPRRKSPASRRRTPSPKKVPAPVQEEVVATENVEASRTEPCRAPRAAGRTEGQAPPSQHPDPTPELRPGDGDGGSGPER